MPWYGYLGITLGYLLLAFLLAWAIGSHFRDRNIG